MARKRTIQQEVKTAAVGEEVVSPVKETKAAEHLIPPGFKLIPEDYVALPRDVYQDLLNRPTNVVMDNTNKRDDSGGVKQYLRVLRKCYIGDCRLTLQPQEIIEYYPRRKFIVRGKTYEHLGSIRILIEGQKKGGREMFERIEDPATLTTDAWGDVVDAEVEDESNVEYNARVKQEERPEPTRQMTRKEMIASIGKNPPSNYQTVTAAAPVQEELPPRGSQARKNLIKSRGLGNIDRLRGETPEKISDIKVLNTSRDSRVVGKIRGQAALDTRVQTNPLLG